MLRGLPRVATYSRCWNVEVQSLSAYLKVYIKVEGVMFFVVIKGLCILVLILCMLGLKLMYIEVTLFPCNLFLCWLDAKVYNMMVLCVMCRVIYA